MSEIPTDFDPAQYYASYPSRVMGRPGYPARAQYKSTLLWHLYGRDIIKGIRCVENYADIGGCFGFGASALAFQIAQAQKHSPNTHVFEISSDFSTIGRLMFPDVRFIKEDFSKWEGEPSCFDLVSLFDVVEHIPRPSEFLRGVACRTRYALLKTPMETTGEWRGSRVPIQQGSQHEDGHVNFFDPGPYMKMLERSGFKIVRWSLVPSIVPRGIGEMILMPENVQEARKVGLLNLSKAIRRLARIPLTSSPAIFKYTRRIVGGGDHLCLAKSTER